MPSHRPYHPITYPNWDTENVSFTFDHEGENTLVVAGTTVVEAVGYNEMGQLKRLAMKLKIEIQKTIIVGSHCCQRDYHLLLLGGILPFKN
jgi:hypothetical protein